MTSNKLAFTGIRKTWLLCGLLYAVLRPICLASFVTFEGPGEPPYLLGWVAVRIFFNFVLLFFLWLCACRKPGGKLLALWLLQTPLWEFVTFTQIFGTSLGWMTETFNSHQVFYHLHDQWNLRLTISALVYAVLFLSFYYFSFRLWRENRKIRREAESVVVDTAMFIQILQQAKSVDELNEKYHALISEWPQFERLISKNYKLCKMAFPE